MGIRMPDLTPPPNIVAESLDDKFLLRFVLFFMFQMVWNFLFIILFRLSDNTEAIVTASSLERVAELGRGAYGVVEKMYAPFFE